MAPGYGSLARATGKRSSKRRSKANRHQRRTPVPRMCIGSTWRQRREKRSRVRMLTFGLSLHLTGSRALIVMPQHRSWGHAFLYEASNESRNYQLIHISSYGAATRRRCTSCAGSTVQADGWNILGVYDLSSGTITHVKLQEPTEILRVCPSSGKVYSAIPQYPGFAGSTVEYTDTVQFVQRIHGWMGAQFSAGCS